LRVPAVKIDGACLCGQISYVAEIDPANVFVCHCTECQTSSASAFRYAALVKKDEFTLLNGELKFYTKTAESGSKRALAFCPECGTSIYGCDPLAPKRYSLRLGTARQRGELRPSLQVWCRSAQTWVRELTQIPAQDEQPPRRRRIEIRRCL
jgi:hypothetical protein